MTREKVLELLSSVKDTVRDDVRNAIREIITLAEPYRYLGKGYTFSSNADLDDEVNRMLVELSDQIQDEMYEDASSTLDEVDEDSKNVALALIRRDEVIKSFDNHCSHVKFLTEGWLAIGFANSMTGTEILANVMVSLVSPFTAREWKSAREDGGYASAIFAPDAGKWGRGVLKAPVEGLTLAGQQMISEAYQTGTITGYGTSGAVGYRVHRGSNYPCPLCDDLCIGVHPLNDIVIPAHPRCVCWSTPVYNAETD